MRCARPLGLPENSRATKAQPEESAISSGRQAGMCVPVGVSLLPVQSVCVVGEAWPLVMP